MGQCILRTYGTPSFLPFHHYVHLESHYSPLLNPVILIAHRRKQGESKVDQSPNPQTVLRYKYSKATTLPIFTLQMAHKRVYVINTPSLTVAVERASKTITFAPFVVAMSPRLFDVGEREMSIIRENVGLEKGNWGLLHDISRGMQAQMVPGAMLDRMVKATLVRFLESTNKLVDSGYSGDVRAQVGKEMGLFRWLRRESAVASKDAIYGPDNPFAKEPDLEKCFWDIDEGFAMLLLGPFPSITARKAYRARVKLRKALHRYVDQGGVENALGVFKVRHDISRKYGATAEDIAKFELGVLIGVLINATPTLFWSLLHAYSDPLLLDAMRREVEDVMTTAKTESGVTQHTIDSTRLQETCPLVYSTFREVLRLHSHGASNRWVSEDTLLDDKYLLKKGSFVQMPAASIHYNPKFWGEDASDFNPRRFVKKDTGEDKAPPTGAFRAWGGGTTLCPGRFFATAELTCILAMMVVRFDIKPVTDNGEWNWPEAAHNRVSSTVHPPRNDVKVTIRTRKGYVGDMWAYAYADAA